MTRLSLRQRSAHGEAVLRHLLRTPKTRKGLIAAVKSSGLTENFVYGFLSEAERRGEVVRLKAGSTDTYQLSSRFHAEEPQPSEFPSWLDPRTLPVICNRRIFLGGRPAEEEQQVEDAEDE